jgi:hypothetical protein
MKRLKPFPLVWTSCVAGADRRMITNLKTLKVNGKYTKINLFRMVTPPVLVNKVVSLSTQRIEWLSIATR